MSRLLPFIVPVILGLALMLGLSFPDRPEEPLGVTRGGGVIRGLTLRPGESTAPAVAFLRTLRSDPPPPPPPPGPPPEPPPPPPPPPPDVSVVLAGALRAIERDVTTGEYQALITDGAASGPQTTVITTGEVYGDGWRITAITEDAIALAKGRETRQVRLYR